MCITSPISPSPLSLSLLLPPLSTPPSSLPLSLPLPPPPSPLYPSLLPSLSTPPSSSSLPFFLLPRLALHWPPLPSKGHPPLWTTREWQDHASAYTHTHTYIRMFYMQKCTEIHSHKV